MKNNIVTVILIGLFFSVKPSLMGNPNADQNLELRYQQQLERLERLTAVIEKQQAELQELKGELASLKSVVQASQTAAKTTVDRPSAPATASTPASSPVPMIPQTGKGIPMKFYGTVKLDLAYDSAASSAGNLTYYVLPDSPTRGDEFIVTANQTQLGVDFGGKGMPYNLMARTEIDFYGSNAPQDRAKVRMRKAYVQWDASGFSFLAGQENDLLLNAVPASVDFHYYMQKGKLGYRRPQLRVSREFEGAWGTVNPAIGISRTIGEDIDRDGRDDGAAAGFPTVQWNLPISGQWIGGKKTDFALSGHWGQESITPLVAGNSGRLPTWSVVGTWQIPLSDQLRLQGSYWRGTNVDAYFGGIGQGVNPTTGKSIDAQGGWAQLNWSPTNKIRINLGYGFDDPEDSDLNPGMRSLNEMIASNIYYTVGGGLSVAFEYAWIKTSYVEADAASNNRLQSAVIFTF